jgi:hypothetical protein
VANRSGDWRDVLSDGFGRRPRDLHAPHQDYTFSMTAWPIRTWLLGNDALHYWTPLLDPAGSVLAVFK